MTVAHAISVVAVKAGRAFSFAKRFGVGLELRVLEARDIRLAYRSDGAADRPHFAVDGASLFIAPGEVVALVGPNGCGKSTLARVLCGSLSLQEGKALLDGELVSPRELRLVVGYVRQDPKSQIVAPTVFDEVAFGPVNLGLPAAKIRGRVAAALEACGLVEMAVAGTDSLSGGELQRLALAGVLAMRPRYLVLDEATAMLDGKNRGWVRSVVREFARSGGGVLLVTHDAGDVLIADRIVAMDGGCIVWEGLPSDAVERRWAGGCGFGVRIVMSADCNADGSADSGESGSVASNVRPALEGHRMQGCGPRPRVGLSEDCAATESTGENYALSGAVAYGEPGLIARDVNVMADGRELLKGVSLEARPGNVTLVSGPSGAGKTTLARVLAGLVSSGAGTVTLGDAERVRPGMVGLCLQRPEDQFVRPTVLEDVALAPLNLGASKGEALAKAREALSWIGVPERLWDASPWGLSGGEARLAAIAGSVVLDVPAIVLDEPTAGLDSVASERVAQLACELAGQGKAVVVVSHDLGLWLPVADDAVLLSAGRVTWHGAAASLLENPAPLEQAGLTAPSLYRLRGGLGRGEAS